MFLASPSLNWKPAGFQENSNGFRQQFVAFILRSLGYDVLLNNFRDRCYSEPRSSANLWLFFGWVSRWNAIKASIVSGCHGALLPYLILIWHISCLKPKSLQPTTALDADQSSTFSNSKPPLVIHKVPRGRYPKMTYPRVRPNIKPEPASASNFPQTWEHKKCHLVKNSSCQLSAFCKHG